MRNTLVAALAWALAACATAPAVKTQCLPLKPYTAAQQAAAEAELEALPGDSELYRMIVDYLAMRDADRACQGAKP